MSKTKRRYVGIVATPLAVGILLILLLSGCSQDDNAPGGDMASKITLAEAAKKVDELTETARQQTYPQANFTNPDRDYDFPCSNPDGSPSKTLRNATVSYQLAGIPKEKLNEYRESLRQWWQKNGFTVDRDGSKPDLIRAVDKAGYSMALQINDLGQAYLMATSPCAQKNGTAGS